MKWNLSVRGNVLLRGYVTFFCFFLCRYLDEKWNEFDVIFKFFWHIEFSYLHDSMFSLSFN